MALTVQTHPDRFEVHPFLDKPDAPFVIVRAHEGDASVSLFLRTPGKCDELISAACEAKQLLEGEPPAQPCPAISDAGTTCIAGEGYPHRDANDDGQTYSGEPDPFGPEAYKTHKPDCGCWDCVADENDETHAESSRP